MVMPFRERMLMLLVEVGPYAKARRFHYPDNGDLGLHPWTVSAVVQDLRRVHAHFNSTHRRFVVFCCHRLITACCQDWAEVD